MKLILLVAILTFGILISFDKKTQDNVISLFKNEKHKEIPRSRRHKNTTANKNKKNKNYIRFEYDVSFSNKVSSLIKRNLTSQNIKTDEFEDFLNALKDNGINCTFYKGLGFRYYCHARHSREKTEFGAISNLRFYISEIESEFIKLSNFELSLKNEEGLGENSIIFFLKYLFQNTIATEKAINFDSFSTKFKELKKENSDKNFILEYKTDDYIISLKNEI